MGEKKDVWLGTLALMVLKTLDTMGPQHGYGIARRIEQVSENLLAVNQGTLYPVLIKLEQEGAISSAVGRLGQQPPREVLHTDEVRPQAPADGIRALATNDRNHRPVLHAREGMICADFQI